MNAKVFARAFIGTTLVVSAVLGFTAGHNWHPAEACHEDESYFVQEDTNPAHRLTWACTNNDEVIKRLTGIPANAFWPAR